jgi:hypothetical protein
VLYETVPQFDGAGRGGFMRRFLTLVFLLCLAMPAGISISGCTRNPAAEYCNGQGFGPKITDVYAITLQPQIAGISLAYGQTIQVQAPTASTCKGDPASIGPSSIVYGTTNNQLVDLSPSGSLCAGTWNRNTGGGIADYTVCNYPNPLPSTKGLPYGLAYITATSASVTSNPVTVYVHAPITSINLVATPLAGAPAQGCYSQSQQAQLDAQAFYQSSTGAALLCAPGSAGVPDCSASIGTLSFSVGTSAVAAINPATNPPVITAQLPGTTVITASIAQSSSSAGYFSTCPPASISLNLANGGTSGVVTQGVTQNLNATVIDTNGHAISGLSLGYQSTNPIDVSATGTNGGITASFPGVASVYATCQPGLCNPAPINEFGLNGTGLSLTSNPVNIIVPGTTSDFLWFGAPGQSQYFASIELLNGTPGSTVRLPYVPDSMIMDQLGTSLYFGSPRELMVYSTANNALTKQDNTVPGVVLAVSPNSSQAIINDQIRGLFYLYNTGSGTSLTFGGMGVAAAWTPDSNTLYIADNAEANSPAACSNPLITGHSDTLYVYNVNSGWSSYALPPNPLPPAELPTCTTQPDAPISTTVKTLAITVPGIGAYFAGNSTVAHTWCPSGTVANNASIQFYPQSDMVNTPTNVLGATSDGKHMLGAALNGTSINLNDIGVTIPTTECPEKTVGTTQTLSPLSTNPVLNGTVNLTNVMNAAAINQVVTGSAPTTASVTTAAPIAFVTYTPAAGSTTAAQLPYYLPQTTGVVAPGYVTFADSGSATPPTAPLAGSFSPDNSLFFVSTAGDNLVHVISISPNLPSVLPTEAPATSIPPISPNLPACTPVAAGGVDPGCLYPTTPAPNAIVPATVVTVKARNVT